MDNIEQINYYIEQVELLQLENSNIVYESFVTEVGVIKRIREIISKKREQKELKEWKEKAKNRNMEALLKDVVKYNKKSASISDFKKFYNNNDFCIEGAPHESYFPQIVANILGSQFEINEPVDIYYTTGKDFNKAYDLAGTNAYKDESTIVIIPLDTLKNKEDISIAKSELKSRYFNDVVDNNEYREFLAGRHKASEQIQWLIDYYERHK